MQKSTKVKTAIVTGGKGFIGSHLVAALNNSQRYHAISFDLKDNQNILDQHQIDNFIKQTKPDVIFNLAGLLGTHELIESQVIAAIETNTIGAVVILELAKQYQFDVVEIGKPNIWLNTYSITKKAAEDFTLMYGKEFDIDVRVVKWFNIFGPGQHYGVPQKLAPTTIVKALNNQPIPIYGSGEQTADHLYVEDAVNAAIACYECPQVRGEVIEIGSGQPMKVNWFVEQVIKQTNSHSQITHLPMRRGEIELSEIQADITKLTNVVGFHPQWNFEQALQTTIKYYQESLDQFE